MAAKEFTPYRLRKLLRSDGALGVTFANTLTRHPVNSFADWLAWSRSAGSLDEFAAHQLAKLASEHPSRATGAVHQARHLAERLQRMFSALAAHQAVEAEDLEAFNVALCRAHGMQEIVAAHPGYRWSWRDPEDGELDRFLWPVSLSVAEVLQASREQPVRQCLCGIFFVAGGRGRPRKFCSPTCTNRLSSRRHYHRVVKPRQRRIKERIRGVVVTH